MNWQQIIQARHTLDRPFVMAHRGASELLPENSPSAFYQAIAEGADIIETDIHFTQDEAIILLHDQTLDRTTTGSGRVWEQPLTEIKRHKIRQPTHRQMVDERILTLPEYIAYTGGNIPTALELKDPRFAEPYFAEKLINILNTYNVNGIFGVISFDLARIQMVKQIQPDIATGWITLKNPFPNQPATFVGPLWPLLMANPLYVSLAHRQNKLVCPLDLWPERRLRFYKQLGVDLLLTNNPAKTLQALQSL